MNTITFLSAIPEFLPPLVSFLITIVIFFLIMTLVSLFIKKRSTMSGIMFLLFISAICTFLLSFKMGDTYLSTTIQDLGKEFNVGAGLIGVITILAYPTSTLHTFFLDLLVKGFMLKTTDDLYGFFNNTIFILAVYAVLFLLAFLLFKKSKKSQRIYSDYLS